MLTSNNLIKLQFHYTKDESANNVDNASIALSTSQQLKSWDTWHHCFGHIGYSGLHKLFDQELVTGFFIDHDSSISDCAACTEAKQSVIPFNKKGECDTKPGNLTHVDVWGKYDIALINKFQYFFSLLTTLHNMSWWSF